MKKKRFLFSLLMAIVMMAMSPQRLWADEVSYRVPVYNTAGAPTSGIKSWETKVANATQITKTSTRITLGTAGKESWYYVSGTVSLSNGAICAGNVHLILCDGAKLTATGSWTSSPYTGYAGINVTGSNSLTIYAQSEGPQMGALVATGGSINKTGGGNYSGAGIGGDGIKTGNQTGNNITINGGKITATGGQYNNSSSYTNAAGIGGGVGGSYGSSRAGSSNIYINSALTTKAGSSANPTGVVTNTGANIASSINTYRYVTVHLHGDGTPTWSWADDASNATATIPCTFGDGSVTLSTTTTPAVSITSEVTTQPTCTTVGTTTYNASVTYNGITDNAPEKAIQNIPATGHSFTNYTYNNDATCVKNGTKTASCDNGCGTTDTKDDPEHPAGHNFVNGTCTICKKNGDEVTYRVPIYKTTGDPTSGIASWSNETVGAILVTSSDNQVTWNAGWYYVSGEVTLTKGAVCSGAVHLILCDGANLTVTNSTIYQAGINVTGSNSLTIYAQSEGNQMGVLSATGGAKGAGIGGTNWNRANDGIGENITINGGVVTATGNEGGSGIGGGNSAKGQNITINGGVVTANGSEINDTGSAGIGGGAEGAGQNITINGGTVSANGGTDAAGIGSGYGGSSASNITISTLLTILAGSSANPTTVITNNTPNTDLTAALSGEDHRYNILLESYWNPTGILLELYYKSYYATK